MKLNELTPKKIVDELDKYIVGQESAKRAVAIALRNRIRRRALPEDVAEDVLPKNILMIGPTGVGKTELARRLAQLADMPFVKVEATKFTEVGYVGRDVESMVRDLTSLTVELVKVRMMKEMEQKATELAKERILDVLLPSSKGLPKDSQEAQATEHTRAKLRAMLEEGAFDEKLIEIELKETNMPFFEIFTPGFESVDISFSDVLTNILPPRFKRQKVKVKDAKQLLTYEEAQKLVDMEKVTKEAIRKVEQEGIIFLDEIDKIVSKGVHAGPDVSREGVQRDLLPIVEGSTVNTKYGPVRTHHILFIAAGTFSNSKPSDLIPELQGRFPIRVELAPLSKEDFKRILTEPKNALIKQYIALLNTEGIVLEFEESAIDKIAEFAYRINERTEDIGARRLHTVIEKVMEEISFNAPTIRKKRIKIDGAYIEERLLKFTEDIDLARYIL